MALTFEYTSTATMTTTITAVASYPTSSPSLADFSFPPISAPIVYTTLPNPDSDPSAAKLVPVLVVAEWDIAILGPSGDAAQRTTTRVTPDVNIPLPSETTPEVTATSGGGGLAGGQKAATRLTPLGWKSWTGKERWGVCAAVGVAFILLLGAGGWFLWVKFGKEKKENLDGLGKKGRPKHTRLNVVQTGETGLFKGVDVAGSWGSRRGRSQTVSVVGQGREAQSTRYEMSGALGYLGNEMTVQEGHRPLLLSDPRRRSSSEGAVGGSRQIRMTEGYGTK